MQKLISEILRKQLGEIQPGQSLNQSTDVPTSQPATEPSLVATRPRLFSPTPLSHYANRPSHGSDFLLPFSRSSRVHVSKGFSRFWFDPFLRLFVRHTASC